MTILANPYPKELLPCPWMNVDNENISSGFEMTVFQNRGGKLLSGFVVVDVYEAEYHLLMTRRL